MEDPRPETPEFIAKLIAADGFTDEKHFRSREAALAWLNSEGLETFDGDIEKAELWSDGKQLWSRSQPKMMDKWDTQSYRTATQIRWKRLREEWRKLGFRWS